MPQFATMNTSKQEQHL